MLRLITGERTPAVDPDALRTVCAGMVMAVIGPAVFIVQPEWVKGLVLYGGLGEREAGVVAAAEMWGMCATTVAMIPLAPRVDWRSAFAASLALVIAGNLATMAIGGFEALMGLRFVTGLGSGVVISLSFAVLGMTSTPDRHFGYIMVWTLVYGALATWAMPSIFGAGGLAGAAGFFALLSVCGLPAVRHLPVAGARRAATAAAGLPAARRAAALAAVFCYFVGLGAVWAYASLAGLAGGLAEQAIANSIALAQVFGIAGGLTTVFLGARLGRSGPLAVSIGLGIAAMALLNVQAGVLAYAAAVCLFLYGWNVAQPFLLGAMAGFDAGGRLVVRAVALQMLGLAFGPLAGAAIIDAGGYARVNALGMVLYGACLALMLPPLRHRASPGTATDPSAPGR
jgi:MFS family permease